MNESAKKLLKEILEKAKTDPLLDHEIVFLRARQAYIKSSQLELVKGYLKVSKGEAKRKEKQVEARVESDEVDADEVNRLAHPAEKKEQVPYKILQNEAKKLGKPYVGISRKNLEKSMKK